MGSRNSWSKLRSTNLLIGFAISIALCLMAFSYSSSADKNDLSYSVYTPDTVEIPIIRTPKEKKEKIIIPPPDKIIINDIIDPIDDVVFKTDLIPETITESDNDIIDSTWITNATTKPEIELPIAPPAPKDMEEPKDLPPISFAEHMAYYGDCNDTEITKAEKKSCSDKAFLMYLKDNIKYPQVARENGIQGLAVIEIIIGKKGELESAKIIRDPGGGLGNEALRVIKIIRLHSN